MRRSLRWFLRCLVMWTVGALVAGMPKAVSADAVAQAKGQAKGQAMGIRLVDIGREAGLVLQNLAGGPEKDYILKTTGNGVAFFDYDDDGDLDLLLTNGSTFEHLEQGGDEVAALYRNDGVYFVDVTPGSGLQSRGWGQGVCVADYDADGWRDVYVTAFGRNRLFRNLGSGEFREVGRAAGVGDEQWGASCAFADYDGDGYLDLYVVNYVRFSESEVRSRGEEPLCTYMGKTVYCGPLGLGGQSDRLYRNLGDGTFADVSETVGLPVAARYGLGVAFTDFDLDGWSDLFVANDSQANFFFLNRRDGSFEESSVLSGLAVNGRGEPQAGMGIATGDPDNDGDMDILVTNFSQDHNTLYRNIGGGLFHDLSHPLGLAGPSMPHLGWSAGFQDLDHDGREDLFVANGHIYEDVGSFDIGSTYKQPNQVYWNRGTHFEEVTEQVIDELDNDHSSRGAAMGDFDNDGDIDIVIANIDESPSLLRNDGGNGRSWALIQCHAVGRNRDAIGTRIVLEESGREQVRELQSGEGYLSHSDTRAHFGLGNAKTIDRLEVIGAGWNRLVLRSLPAERVIVVFPGWFQSLLANLSD